jgi:serine/threonine-protein kinase
MRYRPALQHFAAALALGLTPLSASAGDPTLAEALFNQGKALMRTGDFAQACPKLSESYQQDPGTGTLLALARCQEGLGQLATAWTTYRSVIGRAEQQGRLDRAEAARRRAASLEPRLIKLKLEVPASVGALPDFVVLRDGSPLPKAAWDSAIPLDSGEHQIEARASGHIPWKKTITVATEGEEITVEVGAPEPDEQPPPVDPDESAEPAAEEAPVATSPASTPVAAPPIAAEPRLPIALVPRSGLRPAFTWGLVAGGAGLVTLGIAAEFGLHSQSLDDASRAKNHCNEATGCDGPGLELNHRAATAATTANVLFAVGGVLTAAGVTLCVLGLPDRGSSAPRIGVSWDPRGGASATLGGVF